MWLSLSRHSICRSPPGSVTVHVLSALPASTAATVSAHAPVPHASVGPAPRSHTFILRWVGESTCTNSVLVLAGKAASTSKRGPTVSKSRASRSSTKTTACGLPMLTHVTSQSLPPTLIGARTTRPSSSDGSVVGTSLPSRMGSPMSTLISPLARISGMMGPASVDIVYWSLSPTARLSSSAEKYLAMHRMPLPHISGSEPSEL
mmetsp:Transcript_34239/g.86962  ORF Transcript_34239/g.86962 Transcript_34239/m.86962 type:complete len:204 (-) Transcript_34239:305-916(-)